VTLSARTIILVRHGESWSNRERAFAGADDVDGLTELGMNQAIAAGRLLAMLLDRSGTGNVTLISSDLRRAVETANLMAGELRDARRLPDDARLRERATDETPSQVLDRIEPALREAAEVAERALVVVTHGHIIQALVGRVVEARHPERLIPWNGGISVLQEGAVLTFNLLAHLL